MSNQNSIQSRLTTAYFSLFVGQSRDCSVVRSWNQVPFVDGRIEPCALRSASIWWLSWINWVTSVIIDTNVINIPAWWNKINMEGNIVKQTKNKGNNQSQRKFPTHYGFYGNQPDTKTGAWKSISATGAHLASQNDGQAHLIKPKRNLISR